jgi:hypothetical protein
MPNRVELLKLKLDLIYRGKPREEVKEKFESLIKMDGRVLGEVNQ